MELTWIDPEHGSSQRSDGVETICVCHIHGKQCAVLDIYQNLFKQSVPVSHLSAPAVVVIVATQLHMVLIVKKSKIVKLSACLMICFNIFHALCQSAVCP